MWGALIYQAQNVLNRQGVMCVYVCVRACVRAHVFDGVDKCRVWCSNVSRALWIANGPVCTVGDLFCRIVVGVPRGTPAGATVEVPGYVAECPLLPGVCDALRGTGRGSDALLYDVTGGSGPGDMCTWVFQMFAPMEYYFCACAVTCAFAVMIGF